MSLYQVHKPRKPEADFWGRGVRQLALPDLDEMLPGVVVGAGMNGFKGVANALAADLQGVAPHPQLKNALAADELRMPIASERVSQKIQGKADPVFETTRQRGLQIHRGTVLLQDGVNVGDWAPDKIDDVIHYMRTGIEKESPAGNFRVHAPGGGSQLVPVLMDDSGDPGQLSDSSVFKDLPGTGHGRGQAAGESNHNEPTRPVPVADHRFGLVRGDDHGFLDKNVQSVIEAGEDMFTMKFVRCGNQGDIRANPGLDERLEGCKCRGRGISGSLDFLQ